MMVYRITSPDGTTRTAELNPAGALAEVARGNTVTVVGGGWCGRSSPMRTCWKPLAR